MASKFIVLLAALAGFAGIAAAEPVPPAGQALKERVLGDPQAPITIIEYASLTCPHCARFHNNVLPRILKAWLATGKAKLYFRDLPTPPAQLAVALAMVARCAPEERYFEILSDLYRTQSEWVGIRNPSDALAAAASRASIPLTDAQACLDDKALFDGLIERANDAKKDYGIDSTPSFVIDGEVYKGEQSYEEFDAILRKLAK